MQRRQQRIRGIHAAQAERMRTTLWLILKRRSLIPKMTVDILAACPIAGFDQLTKTEMPVAATCILNDAVNVKRRIVGGEEEIVWVRPWACEVHSALGIDRHRRVAIATIIQLLMRLIACCPAQCLIQRQIS